MFLFIIVVMVITDSLICITVTGLSVCHLSRGYLHPLLDVLGGIFTPSSSTWKLSLCVQSCQPFTSLEGRLKILF